VAREAGLRVLLNSVLTHQSVQGPGLQRLIEMAESWGCLLYLLMPAAAGRWLGRQDMYLSEDDLRFVDELTDRLPHVRTDLQANRGQYGCGAVKKNIYVTPYGDVMPCPFLHIAAGNIFEESVEKIRNRALANPYFGRYHEKCLVSTDPEFIRKHLSKTATADRLPLPWDEAFPPQETRD